MPTKSVNITLSTPFGPLEIYVNSKDQSRAERLLKQTPKIMEEGYRKGSKKFGDKLLKVVRKSLRSGLPPTGSKISWPKHAASTVKNYGAHTLLNLTGQYLKSVTIVNQKKRTFVGLPYGIKKVKYRGGTSRKTLNQIAIMLEYGSRDGELPPRPLWKPAFESVGGKKGLQKEIRNEIRKGIRKYK